MVLIICISGTAEGSCPPSCQARPGHTASAQFQQDSAQQDSAQCSAVGTGTNSAWRSTDRCRSSPTSSYLRGCWHNLLPNFLGHSNEDVTSSMGHTWSLGSRCGPACMWLQQRLFWPQRVGPSGCGVCLAGHWHSPPRCMDRLWAVRAALGTQLCPVTRTSQGGGQAGFRRAHLP